MSLLTSAIKGLAGVAKSDALKEAERLLAPKPGFFSKLEEAVTGLNFTKMPSQQLKKTMEGRQVSPLEYDNVLGQMEGTVNKEEVMNTISKNKTQFKDVVLGKTDQSYQDILNKEVSRANEFLQKQDTDIRKEASRLAAGEPTDIITFAQMVSENKSYMPKGRYKISEEYLNKDDAKLPTHYDRWQEPGAVEGSYRELFVTAPEKEVDYSKITEIEAFNLGLNTPRWKDGHGPYSDIRNPVVRLRTNDREVNGKRILFVEEMQGPSPAEQAKMPQFLRKRIYDTGVKKALMIAKEGGYDGIAWTPGEIQANRYNLSKQVQTVYVKRRTGNEEGLFGIDLVDRDGDRHSIGGFKLNELEGIVGKDLANKITKEFSNSETSVSSYTGLDLKIGGEGLKYLYDKQLPSLFKKYGKEDVSIINIEHQNPDLYSKDRLEGRPILTSVPYIPITQKTPSRHPVYSMIPPTLAGMTAMYRTGEQDAQ